MAPGRRLRTELAADRLAAWGGDRPLRVLDAGAEVGLFAIALARRRPAWRIDAVDVNATMLEAGRRRAGAAALTGITFRVADVTQLPDGEFDAVAALECLAEIADTEAALGGLARSLRVGGRLVVHVPEAAWVPALPGSPRQWPREVHHGFTAEELRAQLAAHGLVARDVVATMRTPVQAAHELRDRIKRRSPAVQLAAYPLMAGSVWLERRGLAFGPARGLYLEADKVES
jgi:ubiquinone/menaquinone biosynthesis C-methylase UbiE